jgi:hypothetical protein
MPVVEPLCNPHEEAHINTERPKLQNKHPSIVQNRKEIMSEAGLLQSKH